MADCRHRGRSAGRNYRRHRQERLVTGRLADARPSAAAGKDGHFAVTRHTQMKATEPQNFETSLEELERIVRELERGDLPLEKSLELFEQGVKLSRECQERLNEAERRIEVLLRAGDGSTIAVPFEAEELTEDEGEADDESVF